MICNRAFIAVAGHLPPLLVHPDGSNELLDVPPAPPLGIGYGEVESRQFKIEDGSLFVLYTDGLVENKGQDISDGLARLRGIFGPGSPTRPLEDLCKATLDGVYSDEQRDDIALLIAFHGGLRWPLPVSVALAYLAGAGLGYLLNRSLNFRSHGAVGPQVRVYAAVVTVNYLAWILGIGAGLPALGVDYRLARIIAGACESVYMYAAMRWLVFREPRSAS